MDRSRGPEASATSTGMSNEVNMKLKVLIYEAEEGGYWAKVPAIPGCVSQGETLAEVRANIMDALEGCLAEREESAVQEARAVEELEV